MIRDSGRDLGRDGASWWSRLPSGREQFVSNEIIVRRYSIGGRRQRRGATSARRRQTTERFSGAAFPKINPVG